LYSRRIFGGFWLYLERFWRGWATGRRGILGKIGTLGQLDSGFSESPSKVAISLPSLGFGV
jgi:hypothetical protein